jgi:hypothetical protein
LATRSPRRSTGRGGKKQRQAPEEGVPVDLDEFVARAARLGITADRVLLAYARIAFADLRHMAAWSPEGLRITLDDMSDDDVAAISEIVPGIGSDQSRLKLYDKKAALDAIARHLGMFPLPPRRHEAAAAEAQEEEDPREFLARELARLAAGAAEE